MGILDFLFEPPKNSKQPKKNSGGWDWSSHDDEDDYFEELHSDAFSGDKGAIDEMKDEFGDDWESEY